MYASPEARDADIDEGARRPAAEQVADLVACRRPVRRDRALAGRVPPRSSRWRCAAAGRCAGRDLPTLRLREVVLHHVDLDLGFSLADADAGFVERTLRRAVATLADAPTAPSLRIRSDEGDVWSIGDGATSVTGSGRPAAVDRPGPRGTRSTAEGPLPSLPAWG